MKLLKLFAFVGVIACQQAVNTAVDTEQLVGCIAQNWGKTPEQIQQLCDKYELALILDVIADIESTRGPNAPADVYTQDPRIAARIAAKK